MPFAATPQLPELPQERDERLHREWQKATGFQKDQKLSELLLSLQGVIGQVVNQYRTAPVPLRTLELEARRQAVLALKDWRPGMGTKPSSFVGTRVRQRLFRYVGENQNTARIPEAQIRQIRPLQSAISDLTDRYGREPSTHELADHMGLPVTHVTRLRKSLRADLLSTAQGLDELEDHRHDPDFERAMMGYYHLSEQEKVVFDYLLGAHGQQRLKPSQVAQKLGLSPPRISQIRKSIAKKLGQYLNG